MSKVPPDPPLMEMKMEPEDESSSEGSSGSASDSDDSEDLENSRKILEFQEKVNSFLLFKLYFIILWLGQIFGPSLSKTETALLLLFDIF